MDDSDDHMELLEPRSDTSRVNLLEFARQKRDITLVVDLLIKDLADPFLAEKEIPYPYRESVVHVFQGTDQQKVLVCNLFFVLLHDTNEKFATFPTIDHQNEEVVSFMFSIATQIIQEAFPDTEGQEVQIASSKYFKKLQNWLRAQCHTHNTPVYWNNLFSLGMSSSVSPTLRTPLRFSSGAIFAVKPEDAIAHQAATNIVLLEEEITNFKSIQKSMLPLKRPYTPDISSSNPDSHLTRANFYYNLVWHLIVGGMKIYLTGTWF